MAKVIRKSDATAWANLRAMAKTLRGIELRVGWFSTNRYGDGTPVAYVATIHEFGAPRRNIPARPFMRPTIEREERNWRAFIAQDSKKMLTGQQTASGLFNTLGLNISGEIARSISQVFAPPLKPATIAAKRAKLADKGTTGALDKPLVETGLMLDSVTHTVKE